MSSRHRQRRSDQSAALHDPKELRRVEHRKVRRSANQVLHVATMLPDHDDLVLPDPHHTHGYDEERIIRPPHANDDPRRRMKHWKQRFWKRRTLERRRRAIELDSMLRQA